MTDLNAIQTFVAVVRANGFSAAARHLGIPRSTISTRIQSLEDYLGVRLFKRSTRSIALTDDGRRFFEASNGAIDDLAAALTFPRGGAELNGVIRFTAPSDFPSAVLARAVGAFRAQHPKVTFELLMTNAVIDLVAENVDIALRLGFTNPKDAIVRKAAAFSFGFFASPDYLDRKGRPVSSDELRSHAILGPLQHLKNHLDRVLADGFELPVLAIAATDFDLVKELALQGHGIALMPRIVCKEESAAGSLVQVLPEAVRTAPDMFLAFPTRRDISPRVRAFADLLIATLMEVQD